MNTLTIFKTKKLSLVPILVLLFGFSLAPSTVASSWQTESNGGTVTGSVDSTLQMQAANGNSVIIYTEAPTGSFTISLKVTAQTLQGFAIMLRSGTQFAGSTQGVNFEFGARDGGSFTLAWNKGYWTWNVFQLGAKENVTYTMKLNVYSPTNITAIAYDNNGIQLANYTITDCVIPQFTYVGFGVLESGGNYTVTNVNITSLPSPLFVTPEYSGGALPSLITCFAAITTAVMVRKRRNTKH
jgi:hypothetical protein